MSAAAVPPELPAGLARRLADLLPPERLLGDPADRLAYGYDNSRKVALPQAVVLAADAAEIAAVVAACLSGRASQTTPMSNKNSSADARKMSSADSMNAC